MMKLLAGLIPISVALPGVAAMAADAREGFVDFGVGAKVAECRGIVATQTRDGRRLVIATALELSPVSWVLVTDIDSGETKQYSCPSNVRQSAPYGSLLASTGKFYTAQGKVLLEFVPESGEWTFHGTPSQGASCYLWFTEAPDGMIWGGGCPAFLISFDPKTKETKDYGRLDPKEKYLHSLAVDDAGWVYGGIGTARCNLVAYSPKTGEKRQLIDEQDRVLGTASVYAAVDGAAYGTAAGRTYRLFEGKAEAIGKSRPATRKQIGSIYWGQRTGLFPDGCQVTGYDLPGKWVRIYDPKVGKSRRVEFDYQTEGVIVTSLAEGPSGVVYGSTCHPMHLIRLDTRRGALEDLGCVPKIGGGNFCAIACQGDQVIGAEYSGGRLWAYDVNAPWRPAAGKRKVLGVPAQTLVKEGECEDGHFTHLKSHDVAFLCGDKFGARGHLKLRVPADGSYHLQILPYRSARYCTVRFLLDGKPLGEPYTAKDARTKPGDLLTFGPFELKAGEHRLTLKTLETEGQEPWCAIVTADLSSEKRETLLKVQRANPRILAEWPRDICRPRTALAHPDGKHVMMAGFAGYGLCGGGIGIVSLETGQAQLLTADKDLLSGHSCITLKALPGGDLVGGTSVSAPGGGHVKAKEGELFILDWETRKLVFHTVPVPGDGNIISIQVAADGLVYGLSGGSTFFVFDPESRKVMHSERLGAYGGVPRHALQLGPDGKLYATFSKAVVRITPGSFVHEKLAAPPATITAGGAFVNGRLCFACGSHVWTYEAPGL